MYVEGIFYHACALGCKESVTDQPIQPLLFVMNCVQIVFAVLGGWAVVIFGASKIFGGKASTEETK